ncbi:MAG TPA: 3-phosphoshikimate 1-carboxyvinyltransferase [Dehalococcoidia bacterium]
MDRVVRPARRLEGTVIPPGDKSISHRALLLNAVAGGEAVVENVLDGEDCRATARCLRALGVEVREEGRAGEGERLRVQGRGLDGLRESADVLDCGNSGTTMRLLAGLLAGQPFLSVLTGDASLRSRPMGRIVEPLRALGATVLGRRDGTLAPLAVRGGALHGSRYRLPVASAQVKSALLLAGLYAEGETEVQEPAPTRDHTERMLAAMGAPVTAAGGSVRIRRPTAPLRPLSLRVPGDLSAAAFWLVAASIHPDAELSVLGVGLNPTRTGIIDVLRAMGADIQILAERTEGGEPVGDLRVRSARLRGVEVGGDLVPRSIDELPAVALAAVFGHGTTVIRDAAELRVKETDRIATVTAELRRLGAEISETADGMVIRGTGRLTGARCRSHGDHRLAMLLGVAGLVAEGETVVEGAETAAVSYPTFWEHLNGVAAGS